MSLKKLIGDRKSEIIPKTRSVDDVRLWLLNEVGAVEVPLSQIEEQSIHPHIFKENIRLNYGEVENMEVLAFLLKRTEKTELYFDDEDWNRDIWILIERQSEWTEVCMSNKLLHEITLQFGITQEDYDQETIKYLEYAMAFFNLYEQI